MIKYYNIPGTQDHHVLNAFFLGLMATNKERFWPDVKVSSVFGNFHYCIWDGGRNFGRYHQVTEEQMLQIKQTYDQYELPIRFVFTNPVLEKKHLYNRFCNLQLELFHEDKNEIVINSPLLEDYIRENYPKYKLVSSTTKRLTNPDDFLKELENDKYYQVCIDYDLNKNMELINSIPKELRGKVEFLINAICPPHCPNRKDHYAKTGLTQITYLKHKYTNLQCGIKESNVHPTMLGKGNNFSLDEIKQYSDLGYKYFKLEGRTLLSSDMLMMYLYYMVKPEWWFETIREACFIEGIFVNDSNALQDYQKIPTREYAIGL